MFSGQKVPWNPVFGQSLIPSTHSQNNSGGCLSRFLIKGHPGPRGGEAKVPYRLERKRERERETGRVAALKRNKKLRKKIT